MSQINFKERLGRLLKPSDKEVLRAAEHEASVEGWERSRPYTLGLVRTVTAVMALGILGLIIVPVHMLGRFLRRP